MASSPVAAEAALHQLEETLTNLKATKYTYVAAMAVLVFDIVLTFDQEVVRVWNARRSLGKYLFLVNRYVPPVLFSFDLYYQLSPNPCKHAFFPPNILGILSLGTVEFILVLRTHALCQNNFLLALLVFLCIGAVTTMIATTGYMLENLIVFTPATTLPTMVGCLPECAAPLCRRLLTAFWIPFFVCETLIFSLTAWKLLGSIGELGFNNKYRSKLVVVVFRDGFIFYIVIMAISVANLLIWILAPISMAYLATSLMRSLQVTVCSRLLLNIRGILEPKYGTKNFSLSTLRARVPPGTLANDESVMDIAQDTFALGTLSSYPGTERKL
ncbi:hypothetical protein LshimejAT787_0905690 [Lyophyllum shimeji]|uniref:DUF6533 domain-containing protein n=1 Tax=Lyophyllum shimeji TaxID=47721 RepID=A0A9P3PTQ6_LYOSH|nr:hypothetical protein LshimejAT787_0905690 [Lyophyllum shimeji]